MLEPADVSETGIANLALSACEVPSSLTSLDQKNSKAARVCRLHLPVARDFVLRTYAFAFSKFSETCPEVLPAPTGGAFRRAYGRPAEALRIVQVDGLLKRQWRVAEGNDRILANGGTSISVWFVKRVGFEMWDVLARDMCVAYLATLIAPELTHVPRILSNVTQKFADLELRATRIDAQEQDSDQDDSQYDPWCTSYVTARR
jgi:hypothetical protein